MSRTFKDAPGRGRNPGRKLRAQSTKRRPIDYRKLSIALLELAAAQAEADAAAAANTAASEPARTPSEDDAADQESA